jgi:uncharacterized protein (TIGR00725 family)
LIISVIGAGAAKRETIGLAEQVGRELAERGAVVVCGGLGGVMEAVCRGAKSAGGTTIGILPGNDPADANRWVDFPICTGLGYARNVIVVKSGRAVIAIDGAFGTLSELGHALGDGIPVVGLETWVLARNDRVDPSIIVADSPVDAVDKALAAAATRDGQQMAGGPASRAR